MVEQPAAARARASTPGAVPAARRSPDEPRHLAGVALTDAVAWDLFEAAPDALLMADEAGRILLVNSRLEEMFGIARADLLGAPVETLLPERLRSAHVTHRAGFARSPRPRPMGANLALVGRRGDGSEFPMEISLSPLPSTEGTWVMAAVRDVTDRLAAEEWRRQLAVTTENLRIAEDLGDTVIRGLFGAGLRLQGIAAQVDGDLQEGILGAVREIDTTIRDLREVIFGMGESAAARRGT